MAQSKLPLLAFVIPEDLLQRIDDFRFKYRFTSRAATIKWLIRAALDAKLKPGPEDEGTI
jgi:metal-responsive CopG/Arc/MetJ family transcriptional regulator